MMRTLVLSWGHTRWFQSKETPQNLVSKTMIDVAVVVVLSQLAYPVVGVVLAQENDCFLPAWYQTPWIHHGASQETGSWLACGKGMR